MIKITLWNCRESIYHIVRYCQIFFVESCFLACKIEVGFRSSIYMGHMWENHRHDTKILWEQYQSFTCSIEVSYARKYSSFFCSESIGADMEIWKMLFWLDIHSKSWIFQTEECIIDTLIEGILFLTDDTPTGSNNLSLEVESDKYRFFSIWEICKLSGKVRKGHYSLFGEVCFESFSDKLVHDLEMGKCSGSLFFFFLFFIFYTSK